MNQTEAVDKLHSMLTADNLTDEQRQAVGIVLDFLNMEDRYSGHQYCVVCRECVTCNLRPCRDGGQHRTE